MHARDDAEHDALLLSVLARMVVFKLINAATFLTTIFVVLLVIPNRTLAVHVGECFDDPYCSDDVLYAVSGKLLPNDEYKIEGPCPAFRSYVGPPNKVDVCTDTACSHLEKYKCFTASGGLPGFRTVEVLQG